VEDTSFNKTTETRDAQRQALYAPPAATLIFHPFRPSV